MAHSDDIIINNVHCYQRRTSAGWCKWHNEFKIATSLYPQLPVQTSNEFMHTDTRFSDPIWFFDGKFHKTKSQNNRHPYINRHSYRGQPLPPFIILLSACDLTPSFIEAVGPLPLLFGRACPLIRTGSRRQCISQYTVRVGSLRHPSWGVDGGLGVEAQDIGLSYGWRLLQLLRSCCCCKYVW